MAMTQHLSKELLATIRSLGETKSKQEEDKIIVAELAALKLKMAQKNVPPRKLKEYMIMALYIEMLGHSAQFAHVSAINLTQDKSLILKRIGYLMCSLFFSSQSEMLIMMVATVLKDLASNDINEVVTCLTALGNIMNQTLLDAITDPVTKLLVHPAEIVRKKAILVLQKMKKTGAEIPDYKQKLKKALCDREPSVMAVTLNLYYDQVLESPKKYRQLIQYFVVLLKQVIEHKLPKEFDYHRLPAPWVQIKLLKILEALAKGDQKSSEHCYAILEQTLKQAEDGSSNIAFAVSFQCIRTIASIYPNPHLVRLASYTLSKFLDYKSTNSLKYMGIQALGQFYRDSPSILEQFQLTVVECLESKDETLRKQTLELLFLMCRSDNVDVIVCRMFNTLHSSTDAHFKTALVSKITQLIERFSPTHQWYLQKMQLLFELGSLSLTDRVLNNFLKLVEENCSKDPEFRLEIITKMIELLRKVTPTDLIVKAVSWILGEIGSSLYSKDGAKLQELIEILLMCLDMQFEESSTRSWTLDAIVKLASNPEFKTHDIIKGVLDRYARHIDMRLYFRALCKSFINAEAKKMAKYNAALKRASEIDFDEDLSFLQGFVQQARMTGAKEYNKSRLAAAQVQTPLKITPHVPTLPNTTMNIPSFLRLQPSATETNKPQQPANVPTVTLPAAPQQVPSAPAQKKVFISPEERAKQNLAQSLFGANKMTPNTKPQPSAKEPQPKKKVATIDTLL